MLCAAPMASDAQSDVPQPPPAAFPQRDGSHDFDFVIGSWKAHVRVLRNRLNHSISPDDWVTYDGTSVHRKLLDSNANFEEFDAYSEQLHKRNKGQALRLYNPATREWSIYMVDVDEGTLGLPPVIGHFTGKRGEFYNQDTYKGRPIYTRYVWLDISRHEARMEQSFSADGGRTWEVNWICDLTR
jgi:hypothetical protein